MKTKHLKPGMFLVAKKDFQAKLYYADSRGSRLRDFKKGTVFQFIELASGSTAWYSKVAFSHECPCRVRIEEHLDSLKESKFPKGWAPYMPVLKRSLRTNAIRGASYFGNVYVLKSCVREDLIREALRIQPGSRLSFQLAA